MPARTTEPKYVHEADFAYWKTRLAGFSLALPDPGRGNPERSESISHDIAQEDFARLKSAAAAIGSSAPRMALAMAYVAISRLYGVTDILMGYPLPRTGRTSTQSVDRPMTVMPFRMNFEHGLTLADFLKTMAATLATDRRHSKLPAKSLRPLTGQQDAGGYFFDAVVQYIPAADDRATGGAESGARSGQPPAPFLIGIRETPGSQGAELTVTFNPEWIDRDDAARLAGCLYFLLVNPIDLQSQTIGKIPLISDGARHYLLAELNDTNVPVPADATLASLCALQAGRIPDSVAVTHGTQSLTYRQLHAKADALAMRLAEAGVGPESIVGVALPRNIDLIVALLAIHKAGGAYLPLDPSLPGERLAYIVSDARVRIIVTIRPLAEKIPLATASAIFLDDPIPDVSSAVRASPPRITVARPENLAYVIYTSGSTGLPKGVAIEHRNAVNFVLCQIAQLGPDELSGILFSMSAGFDFSIDEIFISLAGGGRLIIVENLLALPAAPARDEVRVLDAVPSVFDALLQIGGLPSGVRLLQFGGEALPRSLVNRVLATHPELRIKNQYGPTEATVFATFSRIGAGGAGEPPIGKPMWNVKVYVLDQNMELLPKGAKGELYIGGAGVARGYLNKPELTAERFVKNPFDEGRLYRTGDSVRWRRDGELEFFTRIDAQVKINGLRIELGEIEKQLESLPGIASAVVVVRADAQGNKQLRAFAVPRDIRAPPDPRAVNDALAKKLPRYMVPAALTWIERLPLTPSGKLDRKALSILAEEGPAQTYRAPSNQQEASLASIWSEVLKIPRIGIDDDFFQLGGTSLQASVIFARIAQTYGLDLPATKMVSAPTVAHQAALLKSKSHADGGKLIAFRETGDGPPLFFLHGGGGGIMYVREIMRDLACNNPLYGVPAPPLDGTARLPASIAEIAAAYISEIRKVQPAGPYHLIGWSFGGTVAYEMARRLRQSGEAVAFLGLIDTNAGRYNTAGLRKTAPAGGGRSAIVKTVKHLAWTIGDAMDRAQIAAGKIPNDLRHLLGIAIPHEARTVFYLRKFVGAERAYAPERYPGTITLFTRKGAVAWHSANWSKLAGGSLSIHELPAARHLEILLPENSRFLALRIDQCLSALTYSDGATS
ncbi:MAG TPA: amino acid adenylation domain-containing protein [Rhizomicrobium sp.]|nr:amino acid adenylation domain-containing protein [Rhizomicrobium sp.]